MDKLRGSIDSASDWHAGGMGSNLGGGMRGKRRRKSNGDGLILTVLVIFENARSRIVVG